MKNPKKTAKLFLLLFSFLAFTQLKSQASFTLSPSLCEGATTTVSVNSGTLSAIAYSWAALPSGPVFSSSSSATTTINFPAAGTYTVAVGILTGSGYSYTTNVIVINAVPTVSVNANSVTICPGHTATLSASGTGTSYSWAPSTGLNVNNTAVVLASPSSAVIYTVTSSLNGCTANTTVSATVPAITPITIAATAGSVCVGFSSTLTAFGASGYTWTSTSFTSPVIQQSVAVSPGTYSVKVNTSGCLDSTSKTIGLLPNLTINVTASPASLTTCITSNLPKFSKPVNLNASGAGTYVWFPYNPGNPNPQLGPQIVVRPAATTCYTVIGTTAVCSGTGVVCVTVIPQFSAAVNPPAVSMCNGDVVSLAVVNIGTLATGPTSAFTYSWNEALNAPPLSISDYFTPTVSIYPQNSTTYTMEVRDSQNCISTPVLVSVTVAACVGLDKKSLDATDFKIYPNPANDKVFIQFSSYSNSTIEIIDAMGKIVIKENRNFSSDKLTQGISVSMLPAGIYFMRVSSENSQAKVLRLIKN